MGEKKELQFLVEGGRANAGPPIGPALGPLGMNVMAVVKAINEATKEFEGMRVPVKVIVDVDTKEFSIEVGIPTTPALIIREVGVKKGSGTPVRESVGDLSLEQALKIAKLKQKDMGAKTLKAALKTVLGTALSMGVTVDGKDPREVQKLVDRGEYDDVISSYEG